MYAGIGHACLYVWSNCPNYTRMVHAYPPVGHLQCDNAHEGYLAKFKKTPIVLLHLAFLDNLYELNVIAEPRTALELLADLYTEQGIRFSVIGTMHDSNFKLQELSFPPKGHSFEDSAP